MLITRTVGKVKFRFVLDKQHSAGKHYVYQRCVVLTLIMLDAGEQSLTRSPTDILAATKVRVPQSDQLVAYTPPDLTGEPNVLYSRATLINGSDYESLDSDVYDWVVADAKHVLDEYNNITHTLYTLSGWWDHWQGIEHSIVRT